MKGILFSQMEPPPEIEADFNDWYESEHIPARLALAGFSGATRYLATEGARKYLAIYEIADLAVLDTPGYQQLKTAPSERTARMLRTVKGFTRFTCEQTYESAGGKRGDYLWAAGYAVPAAERGAFNTGVDTERVPALVYDATCLKVRGFSVISSDGGQWTQLALQEFAAPPARYSRGCNSTLAGKPGFEKAAHWLYRVVSRHGI